MPPTFASIDISARLLVRPCTADDLDGLEWFGIFSKHREMIRAAFEQQTRGEALMLVAVLGEFPAAQAWLDFAKRRPPVALLWAVRVFPILRGLGIGSRLLRAAESAALQRGREIAEVGVEKDNAGARRLYERLGYAVVGDVVEHYEYTAPSGRHVRAVADQLVMQKRL